MVAHPLPDPTVFAALGDGTRLALLERLREAGPGSTTQLAEAVGMSRQATRKHLGVLEEAGLVHNAREGRTRTWRADGAPLQAVHDWAAHFRADWEQRLDRLDAFLRDNPE